MTTSLWKAAPLALTMLLPSVSRAQAGDEPGDRREVLVDGARVVTLDDDGPAIVRVRAQGRRGFLGVELIDITADLRAHFGAPRDAGVLVAQVEAESPAAKAGIQVGDVITKIDGDSVESSEDLSRAVHRRRVGDAVQVEIERNKTARTLSATLAERPSREIGLGDLHPDLPGGAWEMPDLDIQVPRIGRLENLEKLQERLRSLEKRMSELEKKVR